MDGAIVDTLYCTECKKPTPWERFKKLDINISDKIDGVTQVYEECIRCSICHKPTWRRGK